MTKTIVRGRKQWIDRTLMRNGKVVNLKEIKKIGGGWFLPIPKVWLDLASMEQDGKYWVEVQADASRIIVTGYKAKL